LPLVGSLLLLFTLSIFVKNDLFSEQRNVLRVIKIVIKLLQVTVSQSIFVTNHGFQHDGGFIVTALSSFCWESRDWHAAVLKIERQVEEFFVDAALVRPGNDWRLVWLVMRSLAFWCGISVSRNTIPIDSS
jgi:hypothetical protein